MINTGKGYAYTDAYGSTLGINTLKTDLTDSSEIINVLFHETTNHDDHSVNEQTAINRGDTGEAIWELKNFQKQNTNTITTEDWNKQNIDNPVILYGTSTAYNDNIKASTNPNAEINNFFTPDTLLDLGFIGYDLYEILIDNILGDQNNLKENLITLGGDTAGFFIPVATGLGTAAKTANKIDNAIDLTAKSDKVVENIGFKGSKGFELNNPFYQKVRNKSITIDNRNYSGHALDQMQNRGITPSIVANAIETGTKFTTRRGTIGFYDSVNNIRVITNSDTGTIITVIRGTP